MDYFQNPRITVFAGFMLASHLVLSGMLTMFVAIPLSIVGLVLVYYSRFEQLPPERLRKFAQLYLYRELSEYEKKDTDKMSKRVILHRGGCIDAPENTLEAIQEAAKQGAAGVEVDLHFTADGVGVLLHDPMLDRTTSGNGSVREKSFQDLQELDAAANHNSKDKYAKGSVKIPKLEDCLKLCLQHNLLVFIDCKDHPAKTVQLIDALVKKNPELYDCIVVCSFYVNIIYAMRKLNPDIITALTYRKFSTATEVDCVTPRFTGMKFLMYMCVDYFNMWMTYALSWYLCGNSFILLNKESICGNEVQFWKKLGIHILPWTVNSQVEKSYFMEQLQLPIITDGMNSEPSQLYVK